MTTQTKITERCVRYVCWLTRTRDISAERAHGLRVAVYNPLIDAAEVDAIITELLSMPVR